eukprot:scaffold20492_cov69-Phaeocystis_antarctica.AAC.1
MDWPIHVGYSRDIWTARGGPTHHANASVPHRVGRLVFSAIRAATGAAGRSSFNHLVIGRRELGGTAQHKLSSPFIWVEKKHDEAKDTHPRSRATVPNKPSTLAEVRRLPARATVPRAGRGCDASLTSGARRAGGVQITTVTMRTILAGRGYDALLTSEARHAGGVQVIHGYHMRTLLTGRGYDALFSEARHAEGVQVIHGYHMRTLLAGRGYDAVLTSEARHAGGVQ